MRGRAKARPRPPEKGPAPLRTHKHSRVLRALMRRPASAAGTVLVLIFVLLALFGPFVTPYGPTQQIAADARQAPSTAHWFGTDHLGRDVFTRIVHGARSILGLTGLGSLIAVAAGAAFGLLSGYRGGLFDEWLMRSFDSLLAIPALLLALVLLGTVGPSRTSVLIVIAAVYTPIVARVVRSEVLSIKHRGFIDAARLRGESTAYILSREILPSVLPALSVEAALRFSYAIFLVASLGFLGVGVQPPSPDWGLMVKEARIYVRLTPWSLVAPATAISLLVIGVNLLADGLKRGLRVDPESVSIRARRRVERTRRRCDQPPATTGDPAILRATNLTVSYLIDGDWLDAVRDVDLEIGPGETLGLVGESGSGKSTLVLAAMRYLGSNGAVRRGSLCFEGRNLLALDGRELQSVRGASMSLVPQDPMASLNPSMRIGEQIAEVVRHHRGATRPEAAERTLGLLDRVRIADAETVIRSFPHQLSGGMQQRVVLAMGLASKPRLLLLDEPTTGLDVTTEAAILALLRDLLTSEERAALYITHDLGVISHVADRVAVLYAGELVEVARTEDLFGAPAHPYSLGLVRSVPRVTLAGGRVPLVSMRGAIPSLSQIPEGCVFAPRCNWATEVCRVRPSLDHGEHIVRCHRWREIDRTPPRLTAGLAAPRTSRVPEVPVLDVRHVVRRFPVSRSLGERIRRRPGRAITAVAGVSAELHTGRTLGLVGESGSGKTTLARTILGLEPRDAGEIRLSERLLPAALKRRSPETLQALQTVPQHPDDALNPYVEVGTALARTLVRLTGQRRRDASSAVGSLLAEVGLPADTALRVPQQLSGGERQRVAIARAFASRPAVVICDEATSSLDVSVQALVLNLLAGLQQGGETAYLFITHDLSVVAYMADAIAVMYLGRIVETGPTPIVLRPPYHPYTEALLGAFPGIDRHRESSPIVLLGPIPSLVDVPSGCRFHPRCPRFLGEVCRSEEPPLQSAFGGHAIACHIDRDELCREQPLWFAETREEAD